MRIVGWSSDGCSSDLFAPAGAHASDEVQVPYWASISVDRARMRKGPSIDVPVLWEYRRKDLPVRVIARHDLWRKVEDPDGARGWMAARLLSRARTDRKSHV